MGKRVRSRGTAGLLAGVLGICGCASPDLGGGRFGSLKETFFGKSAYSEALERRQIEESLASERRKPSFEELLFRGDRFRDAGKQKDAVWNYLKALKLDPESVAPIERIGYIELWDDTAQAELIFEDLVVSHPGSPSAHEGLGLARLARGKAQLAKVSFERALEIDPRDAVAVGALGVVHDALGEHRRAQNLYVLASVIDPQDGHALNNLGLSYMMTGDHEDAVIAFRRALRLLPEDPAVHNNLGFALGRLGKYWEARLEFLQAGTESAADNNLGYICFLNGEFEKAIEHYELALTSASEEQRLTVLQNLIDAHDALGALPPVGRGE